jgi:hypothetical protein
MATIFINPGVTDISGLGIVANDTIKMTKGGQTVSTGTDLSALAQLASWYVGRGFTGSLTGGQFGITGALYYDAGGGSFNVYPHNIVGGGTVNLIAKIIASGYGVLNVNSGGTVTTLETSDSVTANVDESVIVTNFTATAGSGSIGYNASPIVAGKIWGGDWTVRRTVTTLDIRKATVRMARVVDSASPGIAATTVTIGEGGSLSWGGANIATLNLAHDTAKFDWRTLPGSPTITDWSGTGDALAANGLTNIAANATYSTIFGGTVTFTNAPTVYGKSPSSVFSGSFGGGR